jgi:hypothetical protein
VKPVFFARARARGIVFAPVRARGIALPVVLVILALMLTGAVYLLKSIHSTGLTTANLAYDATLGRQADLGLHTAFQWLETTAATAKPTLDNDSAANGYVATRNAPDIRSAAFWAGKRTITDSDGTSIDYVIHRLCNKAGPYNDPVNKPLCMQTAPNTGALGNALPLGASAAVGAAVYNGIPRLHYVITARVAGARGASVTNQMIVLIGA